jgi:hypothetical protein
MNQDEVFNTASKGASMLLGGMGDMPYIVIAQHNDGRLMIASNMDNEGIKLMARELTDAAADGQLNEETEVSTEVLPAASGVVQ